MEQKSSDMVSARIRTANSFILYATQKATNDTRNQSAPLGKKRRFVHQFIIRQVKMYLKNAKIKNTCALACLKETAAVETSSFIVRIRDFHGDY